MPNPLATSLASSLLLFSVEAALFAHSGGLDRYGCHHDHSRGGYHCHGAPRGSSGATDGSTAGPSHQRSSTNLVIRLTDETRIEDMVELPECTEEFTGFVRPEIQIYGGKSVAAKFLRPDVELFVGTSNGSVTIQLRNTSTCRVFVFDPQSLKVKSRGKSHAPIRAGNGPLTSFLIGPGGIYSDTFGFKMKARRGSKITLNFDGESLDIEFPRR